MPRWPGTHPRETLTFCASCPRACWNISEHNWTVFRTFGPKQQPGEHFRGANCRDNLQDEGPKVRKRYSGIFEIQVPSFRTRSPHCILSRHFLEFKCQALVQAEYHIFFELRCTVLVHRTLCTVIFLRSMG
uniref:Uncharacterized protein n=1 Tax=Cacopsylla melanoneura TaxID=428564 RepID=A0A8D8TKT8_9HEMI